MSRSLIILPDDSAQPILDAINGATKSLRIKMFVFSDPDLLKAVITAQKRGVKVRVMLNPARRSGESENEETRSELTAAGVEVLHELGEHCPLGRRGRVEAVLPPLIAGRGRAVAVAGLLTRAERAVAPGSALSSARSAALAVGIRLPLLAHLLHGVDAVVEVFVLLCLRHAEVAGHLLLPALARAKARAARICES